MPQQEVGIRLGEWLTIAAILLAPVVAIQVERFLERFKERRRRKLDVFHTLMATRGARLSPKHVETLNRIDIEFYGDKKVEDAWKAYLDHLNTPHTDQSRWMDKGTDLFSELLAKMAATLGYQFDSVALKKGSYYPQWYGDMELDGIVIRKGLKDLLEGKRPLKVEAAASVEGKEEGVVTPLDLLPPPGR